MTPDQKLVEAINAELDEHGYEDDAEKRGQVAHHFAEVVLRALGLAEEWSDDIAGPDWCRYRRLVTEPEAHPGPRRIAAGLA